MKRSYILGILVILFFALVLSGCCGSMSAGPQPVSGSSDVKVTPKATPVSTPTPEGFGRSNPASIAKTVSFKSVSGGDDYKAELTLMEVVRGKAAENMMTDANMFNGVPADNKKEYLLAKFKFHLVQWVPDEEFNLDADSYLGDFEAVSNSETMGGISVIEPAPQLSSSMYEGATKEGWVVLVCYKDDANPLIVYEKSSGGSGGIWFQTKK